MEKLVVKIDWCDKNFGAVIDQNINGVVCVTNKDFDKLLNELQSSLKMHVEGCVQDGDVLPQWLVDGDYSFEYEYTTSAMLRKAQEFTTLSAISRVSGIKHAQLSHYANAVSRPKPLQRKRITDSLLAISKSIVAVI